ncbi:hypothetical protein C0Z18_00470 [Trinickia dabaoshanensis]|uniref:Uncharacterized protein n=1 Tax=Trinickia dabaoshanensis TaxID=564714 RepID=A0A2N7W2Q4_9BURK|nr:hypothetical protein C0Z18_00470 [Trinickia dabaoshanensis]
MLRRTRQNGIFAAYFHSSRGGATSGHGARARKRFDSSFDMMPRIYLDPISDSTGDRQAVVARYRTRVDELQSLSISEEGRAPAAM